MAKCTIIGKIRVPASVGNAIRINGKKCKEETVWNLEAYGGESHVTDFTVENKSNRAFDIEFSLSTATDGEYIAGIYENDGITIVSSPFSLSGKATENWKLKIEFDKYVESGSYEIILEFDFV